MDTVKVYNAKDDFEASVLMQELNANQIDCYMQESGSGDFLKIIGNFSVYGTDIYVAKDNEQKARNIIKQRLDSMGKANDVDIYKKRRTFARVMLACVVIIGGIIAVSNFI